ncbi:hypothetical protein HDV02_002559 [Globomyces sp. JEL0801]|nr:hypothetical protein HDV02_002559 [Globomyces sp. JEL0801]
MGVAPFPVAQNAIPVQYLAMNPGLMPMNMNPTKKQSRIVQVDGPQDEEEDDDEEQDDGGDSVLGSDLDDDDTDDEQQIEDMILCQFEKVSHVRNKWKCILKDGIGNISGRDMVFHRATGDFDFMR